MYIVKRGHEQNTYSLDDLEIMKIGKDVTIDKSLVRTSFGVTRETTADLYRNNGISKEGYWEPVLGNPIPEEGDEQEPARRVLIYTKQVQSGGYSSSVSRYSDGYVESSSTNTEVFPYGYGHGGDNGEDSRTIITQTWYSYDSEDNVTSTTTMTTGGDEDTMTVTLNSYSKDENGEKRLTQEVISEYVRDGQWQLVDVKTTHHGFSGGKQSFTSSTNSNGEIVGVGTSSASRDDRYSAYDDAKNNKYLVGTLFEGMYTVEQDGQIFIGGIYPQLAPYTYQDGQKIEIVGFTWQDAEFDIETGTLEEVKLYDSSFPVDKAKAQSITNDLKWLNRKIQETVSLDVYDFPHVFDCNDKIIFRGNTYHLQSNSVEHSYNIINKQSLQLIRWYSQENTTGKKWELVST